MTLQSFSTSFHDQLFTTTSQAWMVLMNSMTFHDRRTSYSTDEAPATT